LDRISNQGADIFTSKWNTRCKWACKDFQYSTAIRHFPQTFCPALLKFATMALLGVEIKFVHFTDQFRTAQNISFSLSNFAAFLDTDPFSPFTGRSNRYSCVSPVGATQDIKNCVSVAASDLPDLDTVGHSITLLSNDTMPTEASLVWH
jgi:hypothetical protein